jgi:hypothetical protein
MCEKISLVILSEIFVILSNFDTEIIGASPTKNTLTTYGLGTSMSGIYFGSLKACVYAAVYETAERVLPA